MSSESPGSKPLIEKQKKEIRSALQESAPYLTLGVQLAASVLLFFFLGFWIDDYWGISPIGKLIGVLVGCSSGFFQFFKSATSLSAGENKKQASKKREN